jgi:hypothetical protein
MVGAVTVALLAGVLIFIVWLAGLSNKAQKCYDIYFSPQQELERDLLRRSGGSGYQDLATPQPA